jgi:hypothetical protein
MWRIIHIKIIIFTFLIVVSSAFSSEAPKDMTQFNVRCPAKEIAPVLDHAYHECNNGMIRPDYDGCGVFLSSFEKLLPEYDCQRPFDFTPSKKYIVPAIWLVGDGEFEDYLKLLARISLGKDRMFSKPVYRHVVKSAQKLFISETFRAVLDGCYAEEFRPLSDQVELKMKKVKSRSIK